LEIKKLSRVRSSPELEQDKENLKPLMEAACTMLARLAKESLYHQFNQILSTVCLVK
jgi:hypothetical protein